MTTSIEWTWVPDGKGGRKKGETWNPQVGCREVSPGCRECYAAKQAHRSHGDKAMVKQHHGLTVMRTSESGENLGVHWNGQINRVPHLLAQPLKWREPRGIFVCSMSDLFFDVDSDDACRWIAAIFGVMAACPQHTFMVLTKRPENAERWFAWLDRESNATYTSATTVCLVAAMGQGAIASGSRNHNAMFEACAKSPPRWPLPNVWLGVTAEDQRRADERVPVLLDLPAAVRFVSYEPALGPVDWTPWLEWVEDEPCDDCDGEAVPPEAIDEHEDVCAYAAHDIDGDVGGGTCTTCGATLPACETCGVYAGRKPPQPPIDWVICGGESGPHARPMHTAWAITARDQCEAAGVAFFFKQWGEHVRPSQMPEDTWSRLDASESGLGNTDDPVRVGKAAAGRELDGRTHDGFPEAK